MSAWTSAAVAIVPVKGDIATPVILQFRWTEPERTTEGRWRQALIARESATGKEMEVGAVEMRWRWFLRWVWAMGPVRKSAEHEVIRLIESGELLIQNDEEG